MSNSRPPVPPAAAPKPISPSPAYLEQLERLVTGGDNKKRHLTYAQLQGKKRCLRCGARPFREKRPFSRDGSNTKSATAKTCMFHPGSVQSKSWTCCGKHVSGKEACAGEDEHLLPNDPDDVELKKRWQYHETPERVQPDHVLAVAFDCEMGTAFDGDGELIRLSLVDYFTGNTLIDSLVYPDVEMKHFNTKWSGVTRGQMERARKQKKCLMGIEAARSAIFKYVGPKTIVMGHGMSNDFICLRWYHDRLIDSHDIESGIRKEAERKEERQRRRQAKAEGVPWSESKVEEDKPALGKGHPDGTSLKALALRRLGRRIQQGKGHDSLEDAVAARDLIHSYIVEWKPELGVIKGDLSTL